jgi:cysteine-rich repeat protein
MRSGTWACGSGVLALALLALPVQSLATTASDLCAASADPCVVATPIAVSSGSVIDVGTRELRVDTGGALDVGVGTMTLRAGKVTVTTNGFVRALGSVSTVGGSIEIDAVDVNLAGTVDASGVPGGAITINATGAVTITGSVTARALSRSDLGGSISVGAATGNVSGMVSVVGGFDAVGGDLSIDTTGDLTISGTIDGSGGDGGGLEVDAGTMTSNGNLVITETAILRADATTAGGFGGSIDANAVGDGLTTGLITINGLLSAKGLTGTLDIGGGSGGCVDVEGTGLISVSRATAKLTAEGGAPDGDGGEVDLTSDHGGIVMQGTLTVSVPGDESNGGTSSVDAEGDITVGGSILLNAGDGGGGEVDVTSSQGSVDLAPTSVIDASSTSTGEGGAICVESGSVTTAPHSVVAEGRLAADGGGAGGSGGSIDLEGGDAARVTATGSLHATGGFGGGRGGTLTVNADPGVALVEGPMTASGGGPNGEGGIVTVEAVGRISISAPIDARGFGAGGQVGVATDTGPVDLLANVSVGSSADVGGSIEVMGQGDIRISGALVTDGIVAPGGKIEVIGCSVTVCGLDAPMCPAGGLGMLSSLGPSGMNRLTGRDSTAVLGRMKANQNDGRNELIFDGEASREPLVLGQVMPSAVVTTDASVLPCPACGNHIIEAPETCDDGNQNDGDGCSSTCQIEAPKRGDANGDFIVSADDVRFAITEIFDGDGDMSSMVSGGSFPGAPGVDANADGFVTAADLLATVKLLVH